MTIFCSFSGAIIWWTLSGIILRHEAQQDNERIASWMGKTSQQSRGVGAVEVRRSVRASPQITGDSANYGGLLMRNIGIRQIEICAAVHLCCRNQKCLFGVSYRPNGFRRTTETSNTFSRIFVLPVFCWLTGKKRCLTDNWVPGKRCTGLCRTVTL